MANDLLATLEKGCSFFGGRDRFVLICLADYTDLAMGLGETRLLATLVALDSASISHAHERAARMGHEASADPVEGAAGEGFKRLMGMACRSWGKHSSWAHKGLSIDSAACGEYEIAWILVKGDSPDEAQAAKDAASIKRICSTYGVESSRATKPVELKKDVAALLKKGAGPDLRNWVENCLAAGV